MIVLLISVSLILLVSLYINYNLLKKVEKYEDDVIYKEEYILKLREMASKSHDRLKELDIKEAFESDDEVGYFFKNLKEMIVMMDAYTKNYNK